MPKITREEMLRNEVVCEVVRKAITHRLHDLGLVEEAAGFDNPRWPNVISEIQYLMDGGLEHADCIDSVDLTEVGRSVVLAIYNYIAEAKAEQIEDELAARLSADAQEAREDADYMREIGVHP